MKARIEYNKNFDVLLVQFKNNKITEQIKFNNIIILKNNEEIIGANIFNPSLKKESNLFIDKELELFVKKELEQILNVEFEKQFVVVEILEHKLIEGTHLNICKVDLGNEIKQIVCGAKNVRVGLKTVCATIGSFMPNGEQIVSGKLMNTESFGMLCSAKELKLKDFNFNKEGIIELENDFKVGDDFFEVIYNEKN